jgi:anti-sigma B factor antagonist
LQKDNSFDKQVKTLYGLLMTGEADSPAPIEEFPVVRIEDRAIIGLPGEVTMYNTPDLRVVINETLADEDVRTIAIDMAGCEFVDSTFMGILVGGVKRARGADKQITLRSMGNSNIRKMFQIMGLDRVFSFEDERLTRDVEEIKEWAETQGAELAASESGAYQIIFPGQETSRDYKKTSWDDLAAQFQTGRLALIHQTEAQAGREFPFYEFIKLPEPTE